MGLNLDRKSKRGSGRSSSKIKLEDKRTHCVSVRLNGKELQQLDDMRQEPKLMRGEYLRVAAIDKPPTVIPTITREALIILAGVANNLNQLTKLMHINGVDVNSINDVSSIVKDLRMTLIGAKGEL